MAPDVQTVAVSRVDGGLTILRIIENEYTSDGSLRVHYDITSEYIEEIIAKHDWRDGYAAVSWRVVPNDFVHDDLDFTYRDAWKDSGHDKPDHDMPKARELQRIYLRKKRLAEFCRLDNDYRMADEAGDEAVKREIGAIRQKFRDVTEHPSIDAAQTVEELKLLTLESLVPEAEGTKYMDKMRFKTAFQPAEAPKDGKK